MKKKKKKKKILEKALLLGSVSICDFKIYNVIFKNAVKRLAKSQFSL